METLNTLKQAAIANRQNGFFMASAVTETSIGKIACIVDFTHRNANSDNKHVHARYELNGKRIAAEKLQQALKA